MLGPMVRKHAHSMYIFWKSYMGFCAPKRTIMDSKKKRLNGWDLVITGRNDVLISTGRQPQKAGRLFDVRQSCDLL